MARENEALKAKTFKQLNGLFNSTNCTWHKGLEAVFTEYFLKKIGKPFKIIKDCQGNYLSENSLTVKELSGNNFEVNIASPYCSCKYFTKYQIPCGHMLFVCQFQGIDFFDFIIKQSSKRGLMPIYFGKSETEIAQRIKIALRKRRNLDSNEEHKSSRFREPRIY